MDKWLGLESPRWMRISLYVLKWVMVMMPFVICNLVFFFTEISTTDNLMWTCIYIMSLMKIIDMSDE